MADENKEIKISAKLKKLLKEIEDLTVLELADFVKALEDKFGVTAVATAPVAVAGTSAKDANAGTDEEKSSFTVVLKGDGGKKIPVLKVVRELMQNLTLLDAKKLVESLPKDILKDVKKEEAEEAKKKLEEAGGEVELK